MTASDRANRDWTRRQPCLICGGPSGDPHHFPVRKGKGAGDGLLEMVPLCRRDHDLAHEGDLRVLGQLAEAGALYHDYVRALLNMREVLSFQ